MADLSIVAADVVQAATGVTAVSKIAGAAVAAGEPCYLDVADSNKAKPADANASLPTATVAGIALNSAAANQPVQLMTEGELTVSAVLTVGKWYVLSANAGKICPVADLASGHYSTLIGYAKTTSILVLKLTNSGVQN